MTMTSNASRERTIRIAAAVAMLAGVTLLLGGAARIATRPPEIPAPLTSDSDFELKSRAWFERDNERGLDLVEGLSAIMLGAMVLAVGVRTSFAASARGRALAYADAEFTAEAVARGLKKGLTSESSDADSAR